MTRLLSAALALFVAAPIPAQVSGGANVGTSLASQTACRVRMTSSPSSWIINGYDPFGGSAADGVYAITFTNDGTSECRFRPVFELAQPPFGLRASAGDPISYSIIDLTNSQDVTPRAGRSQYTPGQREIVLAPQASETLTYRLALTADDVRTDGTFTQDISVEAQDAQAVAFGGMRLLVGVRVVPSARIGLAGAYQMSDGRALVDLGELRPGLAAVPLNLHVSSTGRYTVSVSSANAGRLRLGDTLWYVPYTMAMGGDTMNLAGDSKSSAGAQGTGNLRGTIPIEFFIGNTDRLRAGTYRDTVTLSVTAK